MKLQTTKKFKGCYQVQGYFKLTSIWTGEEKAVFLQVEKDQGEWQAIIRDSSGDGSIAWESEWCSTKKEALDDLALYLADEDCNVTRISVKEYIRL